MEIQLYLTKKRELQLQLLKYIENPNIASEEYENLTIFLTKINLRNNQDELRILFRLLLAIANNHYRNSLFFKKIEQIFLFLKDDIKSTFTNFEIYEIFQTSKLILLILFTNQIIDIDMAIFEKIIQKDKYFWFFFYPELKNFHTKERLKEIEKELLEINPDIFNNFNEKRQKGENDSPLCSLIRNDSIKEFVLYLNLNNVSIRSDVKPSIFETNPILFEKCSLIEYSVFYGSNKIFLYLQQKLSEPNPIFLYATHSWNPKTIQIAEDKVVGINKNILKEAIKCHNNDIAIYLCNNYLIDECMNDIISCCFQYGNFLFLPTSIQTIQFFLFACQYNYLDLVKILLKNCKIDINEKIHMEIKKNIFFTIIFLIKKKFE